MIRGYSDHAANERTFLVWVRTGLAVIAFGFVVAKVNLVVAAMANARSPGAGLTGPLGCYDGLTLVLVGLALIVAAALRFVRTTRLLDDQEIHSVTSVRAELLLSAALVLIVTGFAAYLVLG